MQRFVIPIIAAAAICLTASSAAAQQDYPPTAEPPAISDPAPAPGQSITISGTGYRPNSTVTVTIAGAGGVLTTVTVTTDANGSFSTSVTIPGNAPAGSYVVTASGVDPSGVPRAERTTLTVGAPGSGGGGLPFTGSDSDRGVLLALAFLAVGTGAVVGVRQRRTRDTANVPAH